MAHCAEIIEGVVVRVVVISNDYEPNVEEFATELFGGTWIQTSYNSNFRGTYAGKGYSYNSDEDIFIAPQPYPSWIRVGSFWEPPIPEPTDGRYSWNEENQSWDSNDESA
jgi:hypothetical protein